MRRRWFALALAVYLCAPALAEAPVVFEDPVLKTLVEESLWTVDPTASDMLGLMSLDGRGQGIVSLVGLEYARNLGSLGLGDNLYIQDISPLSGLTSLTAICLNQNRIADLSPLSGLTRLMELDIHHNQFRDVSALAPLTGLRWLALAENLIDDISALSGMTQMETLKLRSTEVSDISPLAGMKCLRNLDLRDCPLDRSAYHTYIPQIVANNPGISIYYSPLLSYSVAISSSAGGAVTCPGEGTFSYERGQTLLLTAKADPGYVFLNWYGTFNGGENPASVSVVENHKIQANFADVSNTLFVDAASSSDADPGSTSVSSVQRDGTWERPFEAIQKAIDTADDGMTIYVRPGVYRENIDFRGRNIRLVGTNPDRSDEASYPVIEGAGPGPVASFTRGEGPDCVLMGFVITRSKGNQAGAVYCHDSSPTIANCLIVGNRSTDSGGAAAYCRNSHAAFVNCTIADNAAGKGGAAVYLIDSDVVVTNSIVRGNSPGQILTNGITKLTITYSSIEGQWYGPGVMDAPALFARPGHWAGPNDPNAAAGPDDGDAVWIDGDYHLKSRTGRRSIDPPGWHVDSTSSPCIDAGDPACPVGAEPSPNRGIINLGAYGGTVQASKSIVAPPIWGSPGPTAR